MLQHASMQCVNNIIKIYHTNMVTNHNYNLYKVTRILQYKMCIPNLFIAH